MRQDAIIETHKEANSRQIPEVLSRRGRASRAGNAAFNSVLVGDKSNVLKEPRREYVWNILPRDVLIRQRFPSDQHLPRIGRQHMPW